MSFCIKNQVVGTLKDDCFVFKKIFGHVAWHTGSQFPKQESVNLKNIYNLKVASYVLSGGNFQDRKPGRGSNNPEKTTL